MLRTVRNVIWLLAAAFAPASAAKLAEAPKVMRPAPVAPGTPSTIPPLPPAQFDPSLAIGGDEVKAREVETRLNVEVAINGSGPYRFIVDSGADTSAVGLRIARGLELPLATPVILNGMTARNLVDRVKVSSLTVGPSTIRDLELPALREGDLGGDGILGIDALSQKRLMLDFEKQVIKVEDANRPVHSEPGEILIVAKRRNGQLILTEVRAQNFRLNAIIDTGTQITIGNMALRDKLMRRSKEAIRTVEMIGVTGEKVPIEIAEIGELQLGPVLIRNVPIAFADVPPFKLFGLADDPALLLGTDLMEKFRKVSLDFKARKIRFQLRRCADQGVTISTNPDSLTRLLAAGGNDVCSG